MCAHKTKGDLDLAALERDAAAAMKGTSQLKNLRGGKVRFTMRTGEWLKRNFSKDELSSLNDYLLAVERNNAQNIERTVKAWEKKGKKGMEMMALAAGMKRSSKGSWYINRTGITRYAAVKRGRAPGKARTMVARAPKKVKPRKVGTVRIVQQEYLFAGSRFRVTGPKNLIAAGKFNRPEVSIERNTSILGKKGKWADVNEFRRAEIARVLSNVGIKQGRLKTISG